MNKEYYTVKEVAKMLRVTEITVRSWIKKGLLHATQYMRKGRILIHKLDIPTYLRK